MTDPDVWLTKALGNSVAWYDSVISAHGLTVERTTRRWLCKAQVPPFYSNLITLDRRLRDRDELIAGMDSVVAAPWTVKDSFASLDLAHLGLTVLFDAHWFVRPPAWPLEDRGIASVATVTTELELDRWVNAWGETPPGRPVFLPELLRNKDLEFIYVERDGDLVAGLVANRSDDVIGITNAFGSPRGILRCIDFLTQRDGLAIVGYGRKRQIEFLSSHGFEAVGDLRVWINS